MQRYIILPMLGEPCRTPCLVQEHTLTSMDHVSPDEEIAFLSYSLRFLFIALAALVICSLIAFALGSILIVLKKIVE